MFSCFSFTRWGIDTVKVECKQAVLHLSEHQGTLLCVWECNCVLLSLPGVMFQTPPVHPQGCSTDEHHSKHEVPWGGTLLDQSWWILSSWSGLKISVGITDSWHPWGTGHQPVVGHTWSPVPDAPLQKGHCVLAITNSSLFITQEMQLQALHWRWNGKMGQTKSLWEQILILGTELNERKPSVTLSFLSVSLDLRIFL